MHTLYPYKRTVYITYICIQCMVIHTCVHMYGHTCIQCTLYMYIVHVHTHWHTQWYLHNLSICLIFIYLMSYCLHFIWIQKRTLTLFYSPVMLLNLNLFNTCFPISAPWWVAYDLGFHIDGILQVNIGYTYHYTWFI